MRRRSRAFAKNSPTHRADRGVLVIQQNQKLCTDLVLLSQRMFSIITPSFQQLDWLRLALASVADQEGVEVEHIIQDAGSEGVQEIFRNSAEVSVHSRGYNAKLFVEKDAGMYDAINRG